MDDGDAAHPAVRSASNERTAMAWNRTALSWLGVGAVLVRLHAPDGMGSAGAVAGYMMCACAAVLYLAGQVRYRRRNVALRTGGPVEDPGGLLRIVAAVVGVTIALVAVLEIAESL